MVLGSEWVLIAVAVAGLTFALTQTDMGQPMRDILAGSAGSPGTPRQLFFRRMLECAFCTGTHVGWVITSLTILFFHSKAVQNFWSAPPLVFEIGLVSAASAALAFLFDKVTLGMSAIAYMADTINIVLNSEDDND